MTWNGARSISNGGGPSARTQPPLLPLAFDAGKPDIAPASPMIPSYGGDGVEAAATLTPKEPIRRLLASLDRMGLRYCHWKSNLGLADSLSGGGDLDLLIDREDAAGFQTALAESGFKLAVSANRAGHPGVFHAFALDPDVPQLLHVHAYFQIVTGDSLVKAYHLPVEQALLANTRRMNGVPIPTAEAELALFALRMALKHTSLAELFLLQRHYDLVRQELKWLAESADLGRADVVWTTWFPGAPVSLLHDLIDALAEPRAIIRRILLGRQVAGHLRSWRRLGVLSEALSRTQRILLLLLRRRRLTSTAAGLVVAFVGPKATGKSTLSFASGRILGHHFDVRHVHVGKPPATFVSFLPRVVLLLARRILRGHRSSARTELEVSPSLLNTVWLTVLAYDRRALLCRCWRYAAAGSIVLADRYPSATIGAVDSSRFDDEALARCGSGLKRWLMRRERALYTGLPQPTLVIRLTAPIETSLQRDAARNKKDGPDPAAVERRRKIETETEFPHSRVISVDTEQPLEETLKAVMRALWGSV